VNYYKLELFQVIKNQFGKKEWLSWFKAIVLKTIVL
jgi:hypothetical protein